MAKRVILLSQWFEPEPNPRGLVFARELVKRGYEVEVITGFPNYPGGEVYPGYKIKLIQRETVEGVQVTRLPLIPSGKGSGLNKMVNYASFAISAAIYGIFFAKRADMMHVYQPPGISAAIIRVFRRFPVVYDVQDMWPDTLAATGLVKNEPLLEMIRKLCQWIYSTVDKISVISPGFKRVLIERGVPEQKIEVIYNWCDDVALNAPVGTVPPSFPSEDSFNVLFAGTMGRAQGLNSVIEAAEIVQSKRPHVNFVFVGGGVKVDELKRLAQAKKLTNVTFIPKVPMEEVGGLLKRADALLGHLKNDPLFRVTVPSKLQAYLSVSKPIVMGVQGDSVALVEKARCGLGVTPENPSSIADAVVQLADKTPEELGDMGKRGRSLYDSEMSLGVGVSSFENILIELNGEETSSKSKQQALSGMVNSEKV